MMTGYGKGLPQDGTGLARLPVMGGMAGKAGAAAGTAAGAAGAADWAGLCAQAVADQTATLKQTAMAVAGALARRFVTNMLLPF